MRFEEEKVLCLKREALKSAGLFQGISANVKPYQRLLNNRENIAFLPRSEAERNFAFKQWIPYVLILRGRAVLDLSVLSYRRGAKSGEERLRGKRSIGIGGHVNEQDYLRGNGYMEGMYREVREETGFETCESVAMAVINDDSDEVGRVHFGVVHRIFLTGRVEPSKECELSSPEFIRLSEARKNKDEYESWSRLCLEKILM